MLPATLSWSHYRDQLTDPPGNRQPLLKRVGESPQPVRVSLEEIAHQGDDYLLVTASPLLDCGNPEKPGSELHSLEELPVSLREEDYSAVKRRLDELRRQGVEDFEKYFARRPDVLEELNREREVTWANNAALKQFGCESLEEFNHFTRETVAETGLNVLRDFILNLYRGNREFIQERRVEVNGETRFVLTRAVLAPGHESDWSRILANDLDVTARRRAQDHHMKSEARIRRLTRNLELVLFSCTPDFDQVLYMSGPVEELFGLSKDSIIQDPMTLQEAVDPDHRERTQGAVQNVLQNESTEVEYRVHTGQESNRWVQTHLIPVTNEAGEIQRVNGYSRDITEQKRAEEALLENEQRYRNLFNLAAVGMAQVSPDGEWIQVNQKLRDMLGYDREDLLGHHYSELTPEEDREQDREIHEALLAGDRESATFEKRYLHRNGDPVWVKIAVRSVRGDEGKVKYFLQAVQDITERKQTRQKLRENERLLQLMAENIDQAFFIFSADLEEVVYVNEHYERLWGRSREELFNNPRDFMKGVHPDDRDHVRDGLEIVLSGESNTQEFRVDERMDYGRWVRSHAAPVYDENGEFQYLTGYAQDITDRKQAEEDLRLFNRLVSQTTDELYVIDPGTSEILEANQTAADNLGYRKQDLIGRQVIEIEQKYESREDWERAIDLLRIEGSETGQDPIQGTHVRKDGTTYPVEINSTLIREGEEEYLVAVGRDVSGRKRTQQELRTQKSMLEAQLEASIEGIIMVSPDREILSYNSRLLEMWDLKEADLEQGYTDSLKRKVEERVQDPDRFETDLSVLFESPQTTFRDVVRLENGRVFDRYSTLVRSGEEIIGRLWSFRDITEERRVQAQLEDSLREKETLLKEIHHRVKNNMQIITSMLKMQSRETESPLLGEAFQDTIDRVRSMALIHEKLYQSEHLDFVNFADYIDDLCDYLVRIHVAEPERLELELQVERVQLELETAITCGLIVNELFSNALEHGIAQQTEGAILVRFEDRNGEALLEVSDNGQGFDDSVDPEQIGSTGMTIVRSLAEYELEGELEIEQCEGVRFRVRFPLGERVHPGTSEPG